MNTFGKAFSFTTFGESHGKAIGCVIDGVPAGLTIDESFIQSELDRRKPGGKYATSRKEGDVATILSGVFEGKSTGTPIALVIFNENQKSGDYENIKELFRPAHADFTYFHKYGIRDYRGGGRSSARETVARVGAGAIAKILLKELGIEVKSGVCEIAGIKAQNYDFQYATCSEIYALDKNVEEAQKKAILEAKEAHDSVGGVALVRAFGVPKSLGEPIYYKLDALLADAMMGINGVKAVEIGEGCNASRMRGSQNNDAILKQGFKTNRSGGILGGISNGDEVDVKVYFKPTPSIFLPQQTIDTKGQELTCNLKGRHDPCIATRGSVVAEAMMALVLADLLLLNMGSQISHLQKVYM
ncbi:MAG: chorismate synthase [Sulfurospirillaceae bacterium]|nr:chorismate synthase [Sulfurospirillaceae bacterium]